MFRCNKLPMLLTAALLIASTMMLSGCRLWCNSTSKDCSGISPTFTPLPPTPSPTLPPDAGPAQIVIRFADIYSGTNAHLDGIEQLFDASYSAASGAELRCALASTRSSYGAFSSYTVAKVSNTDSTALVTADATTPIGGATFSFTLRKEQAGWKIDSISGWPGGDITPTAPVGNSQSCLSSMLFTR